MKNAVLRPVAALLACLLVASPARPQSIPPDGHPQSGRWALLVGVDDYVKARKLNYCGADMRALAGRLVECGFPKDHVYVLHDKADQTKDRPVKPNIEDHLDVVLKLVGREDLVVVGFSGHGVHLGGDSYLCPAEAKLDDPATLIPLDDVYARLEKCPAALKLLLVDACRRDPRQGSRDLRATEETRQFVQSLERPPRGILALTSCSPGEVAREEKDFGHGVFMHFVLEGLQGAADANRNRRVSMVELYLYANEKTKTYVARKYTDSQRPGLKGDVIDDFDLSLLLEPPKEITNSIGMKLRLIPAGQFLMGSPESDEDADSDEKPRHRVRITRPFYLGMHEVTVAQFRQFVEATGYKTEAESGEKNGAYGWNPHKEEFGLNADYSWRNVGFPQADEHPVVNVSFNDAQQFCRWLSRKDGNEYRLPTEAEWEYACRAGTTTKWYHGDDPEGLAKVGNVADGTAKAKFDWSWAIEARDGYAFTAPVGSFRANDFGLHDMHGNVWEWCADWYDSDYYAASPADDPKGPGSGEARVLRGGGWNLHPWNSRSALRLRNAPDYRLDGLGFRVARTP